MTAPSVYDHYRTTDEGYEDGIYRVVGTDDETVTLLRVGDGNGRRVSTGELITVSQDELDGFEKAENPDGNRSFGEVITSIPETAYWSVRVFVKELAAHPLPATVALGLVLIGSLGEGIVPVPDIGLGALILVGSLGLAYIGSGRL
jgi:hypothetical protein